MNDADVGERDLFSEMSEDESDDEPVELDLTGGGYMFHPMRTSASREVERPGQAQPQAQAQLRDPGILLLGTARRLIQLGPIPLDRGRLENRNWYD